MCQHNHISNTAAALHIYQPLAIHSEGVTEYNSVIVVIHTAEFILLPIFIPCPTLLRFSLAVEEFKYSSEG